MHWEKSFLSKSASEIGKPPVSMPNMLWDLLSGRGFNSKEDIDKLLSPTLKNLKSPFSIHDMDKAVARLLVALEGNEKICIYADFDLDGTSACALLQTGLERLGFKDVIFYQPSRFKEGYGVNVKSTEYLAEQGVNLVITVDVGITDVKAAKSFKEKSIDLIISDHHQPKLELPEALAIVNPNKGFCESGLTYLCGTGVAFYMVLALRSKLRELNKLDLSFDPKELLDCFVIGTLTDMVPVVDDNRALIKHGLVQLANTKRPLLKALLVELGLNQKPLTSSDVAIRFAPKINALSRLEEEIFPIDVYLEKDAVKAKKTVKKILSLNEKRKKIQSVAIDQMQLKYKNAEQPTFLWDFAKSYHQGVVGLIATQMSGRFGVPAFVGSINEKGKIVGSSRVPNGSNINLLEALGHASEHLNRFGGHKPAAGFELDQENAKGFENALADFFKSHVVGDSVMNYDVDGNWEDLDGQFMNWYETLDPFGESFKTPVIKFSNLNLTQSKKLKGGHYRLSLNHMGKKKTEALWFFPEASHSFFDKVELEGQTVDILAEPQWNYFRSRRTLQLLIKDIRKAK